MKLKRCVATTLNTRTTYTVTNTLNGDEYYA